MITYSELIQTGIFIVALIGLCYTVFKGKSSRRKAIISPSDLSHHRTYRSVYGGSINLTCDSLFGVVVFHGYKTKLS